MNKVRIMLTGITGFVGSHMVDYLLKNVPDCEIYAIKRWRSRDENIKHLYDNPKVILLEGDLLERSSLANAIEKSKPDYVFHFAAQSFPETSFSTPISTLTTNILGTTNLLEEIRLAKERGICDPIFVSVSSSEVYGNPNQDEVPITERTPLRAANPYSISKVGQDFISKYYYEAYGLKVIITRMFSHEGARRGKQFALSSFAFQIAKHEEKYREIQAILRACGDEETKQKVLKQLKKKYEIKVGNLDSVRTYAHIDDSVHAYWLIATKAKIGEQYNIGGDFTCTVGDALEKLLSLSTIPRDEFDIIVDKNRLRATDITLQIPDCSKFKNDTKWKPQKGLDEICEDLLDYWRKNL